MSRPQAHNQKIGRTGEKIAAAYLRRRGYHILGQNLHTPHGEIDILAQKGETLIFVEVKARTNTEFGLPEEAITPKKWQHMVEAAEYWLGENAPSHADWRIDVIAILLLPSQPPRINHYENVVLE